MSRGEACRTGGLARALGACLALFALAAATWVVVSSKWYSQVPTDRWFFFASGREIVEHGFPRTNVWASEPGLGIVVQQWLFDVAAYLLYSAFGADGYMALAVALAAADVAAMLACAQVFSGGRRRLPWGLALAVLGAAPWLTARPQAVTLALALSCACVCELWRRDGRARRLAWLPAIMLLHMQVHMAMAWLDVFVSACFLLPSGPGEVREGHAWAMARAPLALAISAMVAVMPVNPYGVAGMLYLFDSFGAAGWGGLVAEMRPVWEKGVGALALTVGACVACPAAALVCAWRRRGPRADVAALVGVSCAAAILQSRNGWVPCAMSACAWGLASGERRPGAPGMEAAWAAWALAVAAAALAPHQACTELPEWRLYEEGAAQMAAAAREDSGSDAPLVFCPRWVDANYLEWAGLPVTCDGRPEIWEPAITGDTEHRNRELFAAVSASLQGDEGPVRDYVEEKGCGYVLVPKSGTADDPVNAGLFAQAGWLEEVAVDEWFTLYRVAP